MRMTAIHAQTERKRQDAPVPYAANLAAKPEHNSFAV